MATSDIICILDARVLQMPAYFAIRGQPPGKISTYQVFPGSLSARVKIQCKKGSILVYNLVDNLHLTAQALPVLHD